MESRQPTPINGRLNQQYPPEAVIGNGYGYWLNRQVNRSEK
jgi:hypothetical protein